jgi:hypothetical protein
VIASFSRLVDGSNLSQCSGAGPQSMPRGLKSEEGKMAWSSLPSGRIRKSAKLP